MKKLKSLLPEGFCLAKYNEVIDRGLCDGIGEQDGKMCIEAAVCYAMGMAHDDDPKCVADDVRNFKINLNDRNWSTDEARSEGLYDLGIAQLGSKGKVKDQDFSAEMRVAIVNVLVAELLSQVDPREALGLKFDYKKWAKAAKKADKTNVKDVLRRILKAVGFKRVIGPHPDTALWAESTLATSEILHELNALLVKGYACNIGDLAFTLHNSSEMSSALTNNDPDYYLVTLAKIALKVLKKLKSPGSKYLAKQKKK